MHYFPLRCDSVQTIARGQNGRAAEEDDQRDYGQLSLIPNGGRRKATDGAGANNGDGVPELANTAEALQHLHSRRKAGD